MNVVYILDELKFQFDSNVNFVYFSLLKSSKKLIFLKKLEIFFVEKIESELFFMFNIQLLGSLSEPRCSS